MPNRVLFIVLNVLLAFTYLLWHLFTKIITLLAHLLQDLESKYFHYKTFHFLTIAGTGYFDNLALRA